MAVKTNTKINGNDYFRTSCSIGRDSFGKLIRKTFYGKSQKDAENKKKEYLEGLKQGLSIDSKTIFLGATMNTWLFEVINISNNIKPSTFERYEGIYRNYIKTSQIAPLTINNIKSIQIQRYYNKLKEDGKTSSQIFNLNKLLKHFFMYAVNEGYIIKNPCLSLVIPGKKEEIKTEIEVFTDLEIKAILSPSRPSMIKDLAMICFSTGMRRGEALGLNLDDLDYDNEIIHIRRTVKTVTFIDKDGNREIKTVSQIPKTKGSTRDIPFHKSLHPIFKRLKTKQSENKLKAGESYSTENDGFIFLSESGNLIDCSNISRAWKRLLKRCGVRYIRFHALRHTYATKQFEAGIPPLTVSKILGHSDSKITTEIYTHVRQEEKNKSIDILDVLKM